MFAEANLDIHGVINWHLTKHHNYINQGHKNWKNTHEDGLTNDNQCTANYTSDLFITAHMQTVLKNQDALDNPTKLFKRLKVIFQYGSCLQTCTNHNENTVTCNKEFGEMNKRSVECKWGTIGVEAAVLLSFMAFTTALTTLFLVLFVWGWNREDRYNFLFREMTSVATWLTFGTANHPNGKLVKTKNWFTGQSRNHTHTGWITCR